MREEWKTLRSLSVWLSLRFNSKPFGKTIVVCIYDSLFKVRYIVLGAFAVSLLSL